MSRFWARPQAIEVLLDQAGEPQALRWAGRDYPVERVADAWQVAEGWWTGQPVERSYYLLEVSARLLLLVYQDRLTGEWFIQRVYG